MDLFTNFYSEPVFPVQRSSTEGSEAEELWFWPPPMLRTFRKLQQKRTRALGN
ncbi:Hypothetical predicted protein [Olea europaea subsp. europaea]|uniref:Uncharacterized protein n=1 Tax=Olea europaea subsp. europaea TaxID=158383 RepID=A0A8S0UYT5_OLEEU|nr:Hypothetical predicted protein [Olea europaea subsp. europaea]